jgi:hypothetical protein
VVALIVSLAVALAVAMGLVVVASPTVGAGVVATSSPAHPTAEGAVVHGRFESTVVLDGGALTVTPAPRNLRARVGEQAAATRIWATSQIMGYHRQALGFGIVSVTSRTAGVPRVVGLPAWVGFASDAGVPINCPAMPAPSTADAPPAAGAPPASVAPAPASAGEAAVVIGAERGTPAVVYVARADACGTVTVARSTDALEALSVPWVALGPVHDQVLTVRATLPYCGSYEGSGAGGSASAVTVTIDALVPEDTSGRSCPPAHTVTETVVLGPTGVPDAPPPLVSSATAVRHGATGPERVTDPPSTPDGVPIPDTTPTPRRAPTD